MPDYLTSVQDGGFYGWPYSYFGRHLDPRVHPQRPDLVEKAIVPDYALSSHVAPLGLAFNTGSGLPDAYRGGAFVGEHGSWNRRQLNGYKVVLVPFTDGHPSGMAQDVATGYSGKAARILPSRRLIAVLWEGEAGKVERSCRRSLRPTLCYTMRWRSGESACGPSGRPSKSALNHPVERSHHEKRGGLEEPPRRRRYHEGEISPNEEFHRWQLNRLRSLRQAALRPTRVAE